VSIEDFAFRAATADAGYTVERSVASRPNPCSLPGSSLFSFVGSDILAYLSLALKKWGLPIAKNNFHA
jgi:hypothetical protein